jgi:CTP:molybdopterin cytidylyltransferase MocA
VYFQELQALPDREGAKSLFTSHREALLYAPFPEGAIDIDTMEDYQLLTASL